MNNRTVIRSAVAALLCGTSLQVHAQEVTPPADAQVEPALEEPGAGSDAEATPPTVRQETPAEGDIIVTAQRRAENLQAVPLAVSAFSAATLERRGITSLANLNTGTVPGLVIFKSGGIATQLGINIRGVTVSDPGQGTVEQGVPVYIDGVYLGRSQGLGTELIEPERIEVLRGPQGTLFGRNAEGGALQIVTRKPTGQLGLNAAATIGNYDTRRLVAHLNLPAVARFSVQLSALYSAHDGFVKNAPRNPALSHQEDFGLEDNRGWRAAVRWEPVDNVTVDYSYDDSTSEYTTQYFQFKDRTGAPIGGRFPDQGRVKRSFIPIYNQRQKTKASGHTITGSWEVSHGITLRSITSFRKLSDGGFNQTSGANSFTAQNGVAIPGIPGLSSFGRTGLTAVALLDQSQESQEFQVIGSLPRLDYTFGLYYYHEVVSDIRESYATIYYTSPGPSNPVSVNPILIAPRNVNSVDSRSYATYGQVTYTPPILDDNLSLTVGLRYSDDDKRAKRTVANGLPLAVPLRSVFQEKRVDPAFNVKYKFDNSTQVYLRYASGYRGGGVAVRSPTFRPYDKEVAKTWELGFKTNVGQNAKINLALWHNSIKGYQINTIVDPINNVSLVDTINIPKTYKLKGVEAEIDWRPIDHLHLTGSYAYTDEGNPSFTVGAVLVPIVFPGVPKNTGSIAADYDVPLSFGSLVFHADYQHSDPYFRPATKTALTDARYFPTKLDTLNGQINLEDVEVAGGRITISAFAKNILKSNHVLFSSTAGGVVLVDPRTYGLTLRMRY